MNRPGKYALVTGASSGIDRYISIELAKRGYSIVAVSNQPEMLDLLKKELEGNWSVPVYTINIDLARPAAAQDVFDQCGIRNLEVEVLVNNAGMLVTGDAVEVDYSRAECIAGTLNKLLVFFLPLVPAFVIDGINRWRNAKKRT